MTRAFGRMDLGIKREFIDMAVAKETPVTRPAALATKKGQTGTPLDLTSNYFRMLLQKDWDIFQYRVDFNPELEDVRLKKALLRRERTRIGGNLFDGTMIFTCKRITISEITTTYETGADRVESTVQIKFREVGVVSRTDQRMLQIYNLILRRAMDGLKLSLLGRNYYDSNAAVSGGNYGKTFYRFIASMLNTGFVQITGGLKYSRKPVLLFPCHHRFA